MINMAFIGKFWDGYGEGYDGPIILPLHWFPRALARALHKEDGEEWVDERSEGLPIYRLYWATATYEMLHGG